MCKRLLMTIVCGLLLQGSLAYAQMNIMPDNNQTTPTDAPTFSPEDQKRLQMLQQQTDTQVKQQVQDYNTSHPLPKDLPSTPAVKPAPPSAPAIPVPAPPAVPNSQAYSISPTPPSTTKSPDSKPYTGFQAPDNGKNSQPATGGGWNIKY